MGDDLEEKAGREAGMERRTQAAVYGVERRHDHP